MKYFNFKAEGVITFLFLTSFILLFISPIISMVSMFICLLISNDGKLLATLYFITLYVFICLSSPVVSDTLEYAKFYEFYTSYSIGEERFKSELLLLYIAKFSSLFSTEYQVFFIVIIIIEVFLICKCAFKARINYNVVIAFAILSPVLYLSSLFTIRQFLSTLLVINALLSSNKSEKAIYYGLSVFAHSSALIFIALLYIKPIKQFLFKENKIIYTALICLALSLFLKSFYLPVVTLLEDLSGTSLVSKLSYFSSSEFRPPGTLSSIVLQTFLYLCFCNLLVQRVKLTNQESSLLYLYYLSSLMVILGCNFYNLSFRLGYFNIVFSFLIFPIFFKYRKSSSYIRFLFNSLVLLQLLLFLKWSIFNDLERNSRTMLEGSLFFYEFNSIFFNNIYGS